MKQLPNVMDVKFLCEDYINLNPKNTLIYCDPEYESSSYNMYKNKFNHIQFWEWVRKASKNNIILISEYNAPNDFKCIFEKTLITTFDNKQRKKDTEKLFIYKNNLIM